MSEKILCLSIRQPWAWLIVNGWKNIENREWSTNVRGRIMIHAGKIMTKDDYQACVIFLDASEYIIPLPRFSALERGGIVGEATILDCVSCHNSGWFCGPYGFVMADASPLPFQPCLGRLGFFKLSDVSVASAKQAPQPSTQEPC